MVLIREEVAIGFTLRLGRVDASCVKNETINERMFDIMSVNIIGMRSHRVKVAILETMAN